MPKALKLYVPCPYCNWYGADVFKWVPRPGVEDADPENLSHWHLICTHCGKEIDRKKAIKKFEASGGQYKPLAD